LVDGGSGVFVVVAEPIDGTTGVQGGGVVSAAEIAADFLEAVGGEVPGEGHGDLPGVGDASAASFSLEIAELDVEVFGDGGDDLGDGDLFFGLRGFLSKGLLGEIEGDLIAVEHGYPVDFGQGAFEFPGVTGDFLGDECDDFIRDADAAQLGLFVEDGYSGFVTGFIDASDQAMVESANEPVFEVGDFGRTAIGGHDDLFAGLIEGVEGVEEFFLGAVPMAEELDVIDDEHIHMPILVLEVEEVAFFDGPDEMIDEGFAGHVHDAGLGVLVEEGLTGGLEEMGFTESDVSVDEEGVVDGTGGFADSHAGGMNESVAGSDDEVVEGVIGAEIEHGGVGGIEGVTVEV